VAVGLGCTGLKELKIELRVVEVVLAGTRLVNLDAVAVVVTCEGEEGTVLMGWKAEVKAFGTSARRTQ
jgi:hypothetical protein